ncbi:Prohormone-4 [Aphelenchoides bicaudatus]|nr:Prohormone-4 [Aphelenchoides bicaudatus]
MFSLGEQRRIFHVYTATLFLVAYVVCSSEAFSIRDLVKGEKRTEKGICPVWQPFACPSGDCIPFKYVCDGSADCSDSYDENPQLCTAAQRPPVEETSAFFQALLTAHGPNFFVNLLGHRAKNSLTDMGGVDRVSVAISQSPTIEAFGTEMKMTDEEIQTMHEILQAIALGLPSSLNDNEASDFRFFAQQLKQTNFF